MTVSAVERKAGPYAGNDVTIVFPFTFTVQADSDLQVTHVSELGVTTVLVLDTNYSVTRNVDQVASPGGSVVFPLTGGPLATGATLTITGATAYSQELQIPNGGAFNAQALERALDRAVILIQQLQELLSRSIKLPAGESGGALPSLREDKLLAFDETTGLPVLSDFTHTQAVNAIAAYLSGGGGGLSQSTGVFDVTVSGLTTAGTPAGGFVSACRYMRQGDMVFCNIDAQWSGHTGSGDLLVQGLPYLPNASQIFYAHIHLLQVPYTAGTPVAYLGYGVDTFTFDVSLPDGTLDTVQLDPSGGVRLSLTYWTEDPV